MDQNQELLPESENSVSYPTKRVYVFDPVSFEYLYPYDAQESPLEPGVFITPTDSTDVEPPAPSNGSAYTFNGIDWDTVEDHRGELYWLAYNDVHTMTALGPFPVGALLENPPAPPLTEAEQRAIATTTKTEMVATATLQIAILTDATDPEVVEVVDPADAALLIQWKAHRILVNKIKPAIDPLPIVFPSAPPMP